LNCPILFWHKGVWADEENVTTTILQALEGRAEGIVSIGDANEMLQQGRLQQILVA